MDQSSVATKYIRISKQRRIILEFPRNYIRKSKQGRIRVEFPRNSIRKSKQGGITVEFPRNYILKSKQGRDRVGIPRNSIRKSKQGRIRAQSFHKTVFQNGIQQGYLLTFLSLNICRTKLNTMFVYSICRPFRELCTVDCSQCSHNLKSKKVTNAILASNRHFKLYSTVDHRQ